MLIDQPFEAPGFNTTQVLPNFINPCCFGEDVVRSLQADVSDNHPDLRVGPPIQEDYGWGFWITAGKDPYWVCVGLMEAESEDEPPGPWRLLANYDPGLNPFKRLFGKPRPEAQGQVRAAVEGALARLPGVKLLEDA
jgi:hypothetical protein